MCNSDNNYCVYEHISPSGKVYVGITKQRPKARWKGGSGYQLNRNPAFSSAIKKYGWKNFKHNILFTNLWKAQASLIEFSLVRKYKSLGMSYNSSCGGEVYFYELVQNRTHVPDVWKKIGDSKRGKKQTIEHRIKAVENRVENYDYILLAVKDDNIYEFCTAKEAALKLGIKHRCNISACIGGHQCFVKGYVFMHWPKDKIIDRNQIFEYVNKRIENRYITERKIKNDHK